jgi:hypothetical protein
MAALCYRIQNTSNAFIDKNVWVKAGVTWRSRRRSWSINGWIQQVELMKKFISYAISKPIPLHGKYLNWIAELRIQSRAKGYFCPRHGILDG